MLSALVEPPFLSEGRNLKCSNLSEFEVNIAWYDVGGLYEHPCWRTTSPLSPLWRLFRIFIIQLFLIISHLVIRQNRKHEYPIALKSLSCASPSTTLRRRSSRRKINTCLRGGFIYTTKCSLSCVRRQWRVLEGLCCALLCRDTLHFVEGIPSQTVTMLQQQARPFESIFRLTLLMV